MKYSHRRVGAANNMYVMMAGSMVLVVALLGLLMSTTEMGCSDFNIAGDDPQTGSQDGDAGELNAIPGSLVIYCAAGMRYPMEKIKADYEKEFKSRGVRIQFDFEGSGTLLSKIEINRTGDLFLAADVSYISMAREKGLVAESIPIAKMRPVIVVKRDNEKKIASVDDLLKDNVKVALGDPGATAIGRQTRKLLTASGQWQQLELTTKSRGVFNPTVNGIADAVKLGSVDAGITWDSTAAQYPDLKVIETPELDVGAVLNEVGVVTSSKSPAAALHFARYITSRDRGQKTFASMGWEVLEGDVWSSKPELTLFAGAVNRAALDPIIAKFEKREGVKVNVKYNGCGILTAEMRAIESGTGAGFPDTFMACDVYYLKTVNELFQDAKNVSDTDIVIAVHKDNPKNIQSVDDLLREDVRVVLGHPEQCTIGVLSRRMLQEKELYAKLMKKDVPTKPTSAMLVPDVATGASDAALAYRTDTQKESRVKGISIDSELSKAIQPFAIARTSDHKYLSRRFYGTIERNRDSFEAAGFNWRLDSDGD